jgi:hypothetical protein
VGLGALRERGFGGSGTCPVGSGAWGEADRERARAWSFGKRQGAPKTGRERGSGGPEHGGECGSGTLPLGARFGGPDWGGTLRQPRRRLEHHMISQYISSSSSSMEPSEYRNYPKTLCDENHNGSEEIH